MAVTVKDVANSAGVSPATVSRVLNKNHEITRETREAVEKALHALGYERSATRRGRRVVRHGLNSARLNTVALLIPDNSAQAMLTPLTGQILHGAEAVARARGYQFLLTRLEDDGQLSRSIARQQVDGLIIRAGRMKVPVPLPDIPTVWIFKSSVAPNSGDMVFPDNEVIGGMAARYLLTHGRNNLCVFSPLPDHAEANIRTETFTRAAQEGGATVAVIKGVPAEAGAEHILDTVPNLDGLFLPIGDDQTEKCVRALQARGTRLGEDLELISCNNDAARLRALDRRLPNIDIRADEIGRVAVETLLWRIEHPAEHRRVTLIEPRLLEYAEE